MWPYKLALIDNIKLVKNNTNKLVFITPPVKIIPEVKWFVFLLFVELREVAVRIKSSRSPGIITR